MRAREIAACLLFDPVNIRYASGARNMQVFSSRNPARYLLVTADGPVLLYEFTGCMHLAEGLETITEVRPAITASFVAAGRHIAERERLWARETAAVLRELVGIGHPAPPAREPAERKGRASRTKTTFHIRSNAGQVKCTAAQGRLEIKVDRDFSSIERKRLEQAITALIDGLE